MTAEHTPPTAEVIAKAALMNQPGSSCAALKPWCDDSNSRCLCEDQAERVVAALRSEGLLRPDTPPPSAPKFVMRWADEVKEPRAHCETCDITWIPSEDPEPPGHNPDHDWWPFDVAQAVDDPIVNVLRSHRPMKMPSDTILCSCCESFEGPVYHRHHVATLIYDAVGGLVAGSGRARGFSDHTRPTHRRSEK